MEVTTHYGASNNHLIMLHGRNRDPQTLTGLLNSIRSLRIGRDLNIHIPTGPVQLDQGYAWYKNKWIDDVSEEEMDEGIEHSKRCLTTLIKDRCCTKDAQIVVFGHSQGGILLYDWLYDYEFNHHSHRFWDSIDGVVTYGATSLRRSNWSLSFRPIVMIHGIDDTNIHYNEAKKYYEVLSRNDNDPLNMDLIGISAGHEIDTSNSPTIAEVIVDCF